MVARSSFQEANYERIQDNEGNINVGALHHDVSKHPEYLPSWSKKEFYPPLEFKEHHDRGKFADPKFPNLLPSGVTAKNVTPKLGVEVEGIQLSSLSDQGKDELALLVAQKGVVIFRDQDFFQQGPKFATDYVRYFGPLHIHPTSGAPKGHPELHVVYYRKDHESGGKLTRSNRTNLVQWHSDVTYELQPPGTTFFGILEGPSSGGDTLFSDNVEAYNRLSPAFKERLEGLYALHTSHDQAANSRNDKGIEKRDPVNNIHPIVRVHPVTGQKSLFVNVNFTKKVVGFKEEESDALLSFLFQHIGNSHDFQLRANYEENTVVVWDNRRVTHAAIFDWQDEDVGRHAVRVTPQAERPVADLADLNKFSKNNDTGDYTYSNFS
ncbi:alpha-ketoglutarate-dependent sulfonate dioxygenase [[Candida] railenensis]|uniref:Alpha-ketoglutarate-dependent sulfonate dioxygenase n=1 Tax=[Candida] railenensis TaxID=45579 RepID=A0A9P0QNR5_9ASCO|nr:alpha-ketoglutarate-dependent sulfonate dioxygenase [[Candida] railenensis]